MLRSSTVAFTRSDSLVGAKCNCTVYFKGEALVLAYTDVGTTFPIPQFGIVNFNSVMPQPIKALILVWNEKTLQFTGLIPIDQVHYHNVHTLTAHEEFDTLQVHALFALHIFVFFYRKNLLMF